MVNYKSEFKRRISTTFNERNRELAVIQAIVYKGEIRFKDWGNWEHQIRIDQLLRTSTRVSMSGIGGGTEALRGFPSLLSIDPLQTMNRPRSLAYKQANLSCKHFLRWFPNHRLPP
jgi:hypothetical protein